MQLNTNKKIIVLPFLIIFLFGLFVPFSKISAAPNLIIKADTVNIQSGEYIYISAQISELVNKTVFFLSSPAENAVFTPDSCTTSASGNPSYCSVQFSSTKTGIYSISARTNYNGILASQPIEINVTEKK